MFLDIDYSKQPDKVRYYLAKPNKDIIAIINEKYNDSVNIKLGNINELTLSIPYQIERDMKLIDNPHINDIKEKMLIKMEIGYESEWFSIENINENGNDNEEMVLECYSLGIELNRKLIGEVEYASANAQELLTDFLKNTAWSIGHIDARYLAVYRSFDASGTNALDCVLQTAETFNALLIWNTEERKIDFEVLEEYGKFRGLTVNHGKLLSSLSLERNTDELVTRLYVYGDEDLSIYNVNPTGQPYIEDFSYFMYPFEQDENGKVIKHSHFMSDELCIALINYKLVIQSKSKEIKNLISQSTNKRRAITVAQVRLKELNDALDIILDKLDMAKATNDEKLITSLTTEMNAQKVLVNAKEIEINTLLNEYAGLEIKITEMYKTINKESNFTQKLLDELALYVIEKEFRDDNYIDEQELFDVALKKFEELRTPSVVLNLDLVNFLEAIEEQYYWDKLKLGDIIRVKYPKMKIEYQAKILEIERDFESDSINLTISNTKIIDDVDAISKLLYDSSNATTLLNNGKYKWDNITDIQTEFNKIWNSEWDANKRKILAGVDNQIEIGGRGILIKNPQFPEEMLILQSGIMAISKDGGTNWATAINAHGIIAEKLIGRLIVGANLLITNSAGTFVIDDRGLEINMSSIKIISEGSNKIDSWNDATSKIPTLVDDMKNLQGDFSHLQGDVSNIIDQELTTVRSEIEQTKDRISLVVSAENKILSESIASAITLDPLAINLISAQVTPTGDKIVASINIQPSGIKIKGKNLDLTGAVTFNSFDDTTKNSINGNINTVNGWKTTGKTTINGGVIETGSISASSIKTSELEVGKNIKMGADAVISWGQITNQPTAVDLGGVGSSDVRLTRITSTGLYTGTIQAQNIVAGTSKISTALIENLVVGSNVSMGSSASISWGQVANAPTIPTSASQIGAVSTSDSRLTYIDANGIFTGTLTANRISGGTMTSGTISIDTDLKVGNSIYLGNQSSSSRKTLAFNNNVYMTAYIDRLEIETPTGGINMMSYTSFHNVVDFTGATIRGGNMTAKFG